LPRISDAFSIIGQKASEIQNEALIVDKWSMRNIFVVVINLTQCTIMFRKENGISLGEFPFLNVVKGGDTLETINLCPIMEYSPSVGNSCNASC